MTCFIFPFYNTSAWPCSLQVPRHWHLMKLKKLYCASPFRCIHRPIVFPSAGLGLAAPSLIQRTETESEEAGPPECLKPNSELGQGNDWEREGGWGLLDPTRTSSEWGICTPCRTTRSWELVGGCRAAPTSNTKSLCHQHSNFPLLCGTRESRFTARHGGKDAVCVLLQEAFLRQVRYGHGFQLHT